MGWYTVYRWRNKLNGKCYIGITTNPEKRKQQHVRGYREDSWISQAIMKHGIENFGYDELNDGLKKEDALKRERELILEYGEEHHASTITEGTAISIIHDPCSEIEAAVKYKTSRGTIHNIRSGKTWTHLDRSSAPIYADGRRKLTDDDIRAIFLDVRSQSIIAKKYGINQTTVSNIKLKKRGANITNDLECPIENTKKQNEILKYAVFRILNTVDNKCFIGMSKEPKKRMSQILSGHGGSKPFKQDLEKYGKGVFIRQIIDTFEDKKEGGRRMQTLIMRNNALYPNGYNMGLGGHGSRGHIWDRKQRAKITGSRNKRSKLTEADAVAIYWDPRKRSEIAREYGISTTMVTKIKRGKAWGHVTQ